MKVNKQCMITNYRKAKETIVSLLKTGCCSVTFRMTFCSTVSNHDLSHQKSEIKFLIHYEEHDWEISSPFIVTIFMQAIGKWIVSHDMLMCEDKDQMDAFADTVIREQSCVTRYLQFSFQLRFYLLVWRKNTYSLFQLF